MRPAQSGNERGADSLRRQDRDCSDEWNPKRGDDSHRQFDEAVFETVRCGRSEELRGRSENRSAFSTEQPVETNRCHLCQIVGRRPESGCVVNVAMRVNGIEQRGRKCVARRAKTDRRYASCCSDRFVCAREIRGDRFARRSGECVVVCVRVAGDFVTRFGGKFQRCTGFVVGFVITSDCEKGGFDFQLGKKRARAGQSKCRYRAARARVDQVATKSVNRGVAAKRIEIDGDRRKRGQTRTNSGDSRCTRNRNRRYRSESRGRSDEFLARTPAGIFLIERRFRRYQPRRRWRR